MDKNKKSDEVNTTPKFAFGMPFASTTPTVNFNFGSKTSTSPATTTATTGFSFGGGTSKPCTFKNVSATNNDDKVINLDDEDEEPPKVEFKEVQEEGHTFKMRCKVFVKKESAFADKGVGNLFLKPVPEKDKVQLIVRADTNLGNLLCNFILSESIPIHKKGAKDVLLMCVPTPEFTSPVPLLLRVKTSEEAETLYQELEKNKR